MDKQETLDFIQQFTDYQETGRNKTHFVLQKKDPYDLIFSKENITYQDQCISYSHIHKIKLSLCSRIYNSGVISKGPVDFFLKSWKYGTPLTVPIQLIYFIDMDIYFDDTSLSFEGFIDENLKEIIELLNEHHLVIVDPIGIQEMVKKTSDYRELQIDIHKNFKNLAKKYHLDNPRGTYVLK